MPIPKRRRSTQERQAMRMLFMVNTLLAAVAACAEVVAVTVTLCIATPASAAEWECPKEPAQLAGKRLDGLRLAQKDLRCADLRGASLAGAELGQADLTGADLRGADLTGASLIQTHLRGADLRGVRLDGLRLVQDDLRGADLRGASLQGADLGQADLTGANLRGADLTSASLIQAHLRGTDLRGAKLWWVNTVQAEVTGAHIGVVERGVVQLWRLLDLGVIAWFAVRAARAVRARARDPALSLWRALAGAAITVIGVYIAILVFSGGFIWMAVPLWTVDPGPLGAIAISVWDWLLPIVSFVGLWLWRLLPFILLVTGLFFGALFLRKEWRGD